MNGLNEWPEAVYLKFNRACKNEDEGKEGARIRYIRTDIFNEIANVGDCEFRRINQQLAEAKETIKGQQAVIDNLRDENKQNTRTMLDLHNKLRRFQE